jgi:hypothetical protein
MQEKGIFMEKDTFDAITRRLGAGSTRRQALWALRGVVLTGMASSLGWAEASEARGRHKHHRRKKSETQQTGCSAVAVPQCPACHDPRCDEASGEYVCHYACAAGNSCCNGQCKPPCDNGCERERNQSCSCEQPPAGTRYCPAEDQCASTDCPTGTTFNAAACACLCPDTREICAVGNQCCGPLSSCTQDGCCPQDHLCERGGVTRCCY